ncbi:MAG: GAF domain-containing protein [Bacteroidales bacterium]|nr:GAF domain-containing protein [Bacteroidales bacterium]
MKAFNFLKIGYKMVIFILIIAIFCIAGMYNIHNKSTLIEQKLGIIINKGLKNYEYLNNLQNEINKAHLDIVQAVNLFSLNNKSVIGGKISTVNNYLESANNQFNLFDKNISATDIYQYKNINSLSVNFTKYCDIARSMITYLGSADSIEIIQYFYLNSYLVAHRNIDASIKTINDETIKSINLNYLENQNIVEKTKTNSFIYFSLIILLLTISAIILENSISKPIRQTVQYIRRLSRGELPENLKVESKDEIGEIQSVVNQFVSGLRKTANFAKQIGEGNLTIDYEPLSDKDILGNALLEMRKGLQDAKEEENKRKIEDDKRNWTTQGLAKFGEILRKDNDNLNKLSNEIISNLIEYINANQGGLFVYNDEEEDDKHLELIASYAFNRKKFLKKKIQIGEGLVGTCVVEKNTIYMTEVPEEYIEITSGLGDSNPRSILIVPLKLEDKIFGVIELASFNKFEPYQIEFVEKIGESIASTLSSVKINARTAALLDETKLQAEEMATKEEEMRQNLEELKATQEEMERIKKREVEKTEEMIKTMEEQRKMLVNILDQVPEKVVLKDKDGKMVLVNNAVAKEHKTTAEQLIGQSDFDFYDEKTAKELYSEELEIMSTSAKTFERVEEIAGEKRVIKTTKMPFFIPYLKQTGLLGVQTDITELSKLQEKEKELEKEIKRLKEEIDKLKKG